MEQTCLNCKHASWKKTLNGRLHPSGDGLCTFQLVMPPIPKACYILFNREIVLHGRSISRHEAHSDCPCWKEKD